MYCMAKFPLFKEGKPKAGRLYTTRVEVDRSDSYLKSYILANYETN